MAADLDPSPKPGRDAGAGLVTLDGPAGVGKSTTARAVARELGYRYLDSGSLYRSVTFALLSAGVPEEDWPSLSAEELAGLGLEVRPGGETVEIRLGGRLLDEELRSETVTRNVSRVAQVAAVRRWLYRAQRAAAAEGRLVADGRDMGTVIFPDAVCKIFLTASAEERARRRYKQLKDKGESVNLSRLFRDIEKRDERDSNREPAPLVAAKDAITIDSTNLSVDEVMHAVHKAVENSGVSF